MTTTREDVVAFVCVFFSLSKISSSSSMIEQFLGVCSNLNTVTVAVRQRREREREI